MERVANCCSVWVGWGCCGRLDVRLLSRLAELCN